GRHRAAGAQPQERAAAARPSRRGGGDDGKLHECVHRGNAAVTEEARRYIEGHTAVRPVMGVVLGSGLGAFADELEESTSIAYADIPGWPHSTAVGHAGKLVVGYLGELPVAVMAGRA